MKEKPKVALDIDVVTIEVWKEKKDPRKSEVNKFFRFIDKNKKKFDFIVTPNIIKQIETWKDKKLVGRISNFYKRLAKKYDPKEEIKNFEKLRRTKIEEFAKKFANEVKIKLEDSLTILIYSLLGTKYFITLNKKHLRNKYAAIKTAAWKYGIETPEIMLPSEFTSFFSQLFKQKPSSSPSDLSSNNNRICGAKCFSHFFFNLFHEFNLSFNLFKVFPLTILIFLSILPLAQARSFIVYNTSAPSQIYFIVNGTTGYVGIGLINPAYPLHVVGNAYFANDIICSGCINSNDIANGAVGLNQLAGMSCPEGSAIRVLGNGQLVCIQINATQGVINGSGTAGYIPYFTSSNTIGNSPFYLTSNNLNLGQQSLINALWVNATNLNASNTVYATVIRGVTIYQGADQVIDTITANNPISVSGSGNSRTIGLNYDNNFTLVGSSLSLSNTGVTAGIYGSASKVAQFTVNAQGRITSASNVDIAIDASQITSGIISGARLDSNVAWLNRSQTWTASQTFAENVWFNKNVFIAGNLSYVNVNTLNVNGSLIPIFSNMFDVGNLTYKWRNVTAVNIVGDNVYSGGNAVLTTATSFSAAGESDISVSGNYNSLNLQINANAVGTNEIADNAVTTSKIASVDCGAGKVLQQIGGGGYYCVDVNPANVINGTGASGQVAFFTGSNTIGGSNNLYWDNANSRLGINVIGTPAYTLHVNGTARIMNTLDMNNANIQNINHLIIADPGAGEGLGWNNTAASWTIDVSPLDRSNADGNLNLYGTSNNIIAWRPTYIYTSATPQLVINSTGTTAQFILQTSNTVRGNMTADNSGNVYITPGNYLIVPSGNVGIGTTSPGEKLEVSGNVKLSGYINVAGSYIRKVGSSIVISDV